MTHESQQKHFKKPEWLQGYNFHPVIHLPKIWYIHDFSKGEDPTPLDHPYSVGRYNESREALYKAPRFQKEQRHIHMGIDIAGPVGEPVHSFYDGLIFKIANNKGAGNYGPTLLLKYEFDGHPLFALYGHLSLKSIANKQKGDPVARGEIIGWLGDRSVNGGWIPHLHFQLSLKEPATADLPGVVSKKQHAQALKDYPNPGWVLGPIDQQPLPPPST